VKERVTPCNRVENAVASSRSRRAGYARRRKLNVARKGKIVNRYEVSALTTTVGVLVGVPIMMSLVKIARATRKSFPVNNEVAVRRRLDSEFGYGLACVIRANRSNT